MLEDDRKLEPEYMPEEEIKKRRRCSTVFRNRYLDIPNPSQSGVWRAVLRAADAEAEIKGIFETGEEFYLHFDGKNQQEGISSCGYAE